VADVQGGQPGPILLIRAEMDALPVGEATGLDYESHAPGIMHACGHDAHVATALGTAQILADLRVELGGTVRFCFQPAEELLAGAQRMIAEGATVRRQPRARGARPRSCSLRNRVGDPRARARRRGLLQPASPRTRRPRRHAAPVHRSGVRR